MPRTPRTPRTPEQASERNAQRWNDRQRARLPLFMDAGLEGDLIRTGVLRDRRPDHQVRLNEDLRERLGALEAAAAVRGEQFRRSMKSHCPETYPAALRQLRRLRALAPSLRRAMHTSDHWLTALRRALPKAHSWSSWTRSGQSTPRYCGSWQTSTRAFNERPRLAR